MQPSDKTGEPLESGICGTFMARIAAGPQPEYKSNAVGPIETVYRVPSQSVYFGDSWPPKQATAVRPPAKVAFAVPPQSDSSERIRLFKEWIARNTSRGSALHA